MFARGERPKDIARTMLIPRRDVLRAGLAAAAYAGFAHHTAFAIERPHAPKSPGSSPWDQLPAILAAIVPPQFPALDFDILDYGASTHSRADSAPAINAAIVACNQAGGGRVVVPAGRWTSNGPIHLLSNVNLFVEEGAVVTFGSDPTDYLPVQLVRWDGKRCYNYSPFIYARQQTNIAITGAGVFNGQGAQHWDGWANKSGPGAALLKAMAEADIPVVNRIFGTGYYMRPTMFEPYDCQNILVEGVTFKDSPYWTLHPTFCTNVTIQNVTVEPGGRNDDGCDPDSCRDVLVAGCRFTTEDDNVSVKAGQLPEAAGLPACENIVFQNCDCIRSSWGGLTIGSNLGGGIRNVFFENCSIGKCLIAHYIKGWEHYGGSVEGVYIRNNKAGSCENLFAVGPDVDTGAGSFGPPVVSSISMQNVSCDDSKGTAILFNGDPDRPIAGVTLSDIAINSSSGQRALDIVNTTEITATGITLNGMPVSIGP